MNSVWLRRFWFALVSIIPVLAIAFFQGRMNHYSTLLQKYECNRAVCDADFDGDGIRGKLFINHDAPISNFDSWFVVEDSGRQLVKQPRRSYDTTLRTHAAIINESLPTRLIIYDHVQDGNPPRDLVFAYDGSGKMIEVPPQKVDLDVLAAFAATDDAGTRNQWLLFQFAKPVLVCYLAVLIVFASYRRKKRLSKEAF
jgi:hypothetical protein